MKTLLAAIVNLLLIITISKPAIGFDYGVELDLDNTLSNGPDTISASVGDTVSVDIWLTGSGINLFSFVICVCHLDGSLEFQEAIVDPPGFIPDPVTVASSCVTVGAKNYDVGVPPPFFVGTLTYHATVDNSFGELIIDEESSHWDNILFETGQFEEIVEAFIQVGTTGTETSAWGVVKRMFR